MRILILTDDRLGTSMAGPAIRAFEMARHLAKYHTVTLASTQPITLTAQAFETRQVKPFDLFRFAKSFDALIVGGLLLANHSALMRLDISIILDIYDPLLFEDLGHLQGRLGNYLYRQHHHDLERQLARADYMVCASERQRDYWIGRLCAMGRLHPKQYLGDPSFRSLIDCVPFGISEAPPVRTSAKLRGHLIHPEDTLFLWGGGLWDWLDPLTPIRAIGKLQREYPTLKLVFLAGKSPNPTTPIMPMVEKARDLAKELGALNQSVYFYEHWIPYEERGSLLLESDVGIIAHPDWIETRFSFRTRVLDYLWAGLPVISTEGDSLSDIVKQEQLGMTCRYENPEDWQSAFCAMADPESRAAYQKRIAPVRERLTWQQNLKPLVHFLESPQQSTPPLRRIPGIHRAPLSTLAKSTLILMDEGPQGLMSRVQRVLSRHV